MANYHIEQHGTMPVLTLNEDSGEMEYHGTMPVCTEEGGDNSGENAAAGFLADDPATAAAAEDYENATDDEKLAEPLTITCTGDHRRVVAHETPSSPRPIMAIRPTPRITLQDQMREEIRQRQCKIILRRTWRKNGVSDFALAVDTLKRKRVLKKHGDEGLVHDIMNTERWDDLPQHLILTMRDISSARRIDVRAQALNVDVGFLQSDGERREWRKYRKLKRLL